MSHEDLETVKKLLDFANTTVERLGPRATSYSQIDDEMRKVLQTVKGTGAAKKVAKRINKLTGNRLVHKIHFLGHHPYDNHKIASAHFLGVTLQLKKIFACELRTTISFRTKLENFWLSRQDDVVVETAADMFFKHDDLGLEIIFAPDLERFEYLDYIFWKNREINPADFLVITTKFSNALIDSDAEDLPYFVKFVKKAKVIGMPKYQPYTEFRLSRINTEHQPQDAMENLGIHYWKNGSFSKINPVEKSLMETEDTLLFECRCEAAWRIHLLQSELEVDEKSDGELDEIIGNLPLLLGNLYF
ncbi:unnamed protein product, partial [Mesorhabditis spiculigera]